MAGTADNAHPKALAQAATEEVASRIAGVIDEFRPTILITFGPEGVYLHPDHVSIHHASMAAIAHADIDPGAHRPSIIMLVSMERELFLEAFKEPGTMFENVPYETLKQMGTPRDEITHRIDISDWLPQKLAALARHRSQFGDQQAFSDLPPEIAETVLRTELFRQQPLPWDKAAPAPFPLGGKVEAGGGQEEIR
jgi:N-acetyl-1-D-myo-inositol-2-amino-2-deoxy-alpha-D-glucopyranoside deacetylase